MPGASSRASARPAWTRSGRRCGSARSRTSPTLAPRSATRTRRRSSTPSSSRCAGTNVMIGHGVAIYGAADRYLGMLATTLGEWGSAERHFEAAMEMNREMGRGHLARAHGLRVRTDAARPRRPRRSRHGRPAPRGGGRACRANRHADAARASPGARVARRAGARLPDGLSAREVQILGLVARGLSNREIGTELVISEHTAANHIRSILRKTGSANRTEAASYAHRHGLTGS